MNRIQNFLQGSRQDCCGCGTCVANCPVKAIEMRPLELGCLYPVVNSSLCIDCGLCLRACAFTKRMPKQSHVLKAYAASARKQELLHGAASGGVFSSIAYSVLQKGGAVFGCSLEKQGNTLTPVHICIRNTAELVKLQGSKYTQSNLGDTFFQVQELLREGLSVLFCGTPCQVDALQQFIPLEERRYLYTMDLVCHGVPSAGLFRDYLSNLNKDFISFRFRSKRSGWGLRGSYTYKCGTQEKTSDFPPGLSSYYSYFLESEIYRESCYACPYANVDRPGDLTIGDFWGIEKEHPEYLTKNGGPLNSDKGVSMLFANTAKGLELLETHGVELVLLQSDPEKVIKENRQLIESSSSTALRDVLISTHFSEGYRGIERTWRKNLGIRYYYRYIKEIIRVICRKIKKTDSIQ